LPRGKKKEKKKRERERGEKRTRGGSYGGVCFSQHPTRGGRRKGGGKRREEGTEGEKSPSAGSLPLKIKSLEKKKERKGEGKGGKKGKKKDGRNQCGLF